MAVSPKRVSKANKRMRRSHHAITATQFSACPNCGEPKVSHKVCLECGYYDGKQVIGQEETNA
ncbi:MAG: 50S ribosomal protein L32 [Fusobacteria bacterium]|nr:50S ribosomal protein L32 [Fusobacteriota bacterium]